MNSFTSTRGSSHFRSSGRTLRLAGRGSARFLSSLRTRCSGRRRTLVHLGSIIGFPEIGSFGDGRFTARAFLFRRASCALFGPFFFGSVRFEISGFFELILDLVKAAACVLGGSVAVFVGDTLEIDLFWGFVNGWCGLQYAIRVRDGGWG